MITFIRSGKNPNHIEFRKDGSDKVLLMNRTGDTEDDYGSWKLAEPGRFAIAGWPHDAVMRGTNGKTVFKPYVIQFVKEWFDEQDVPPMTSSGPEVYGYPEVMRWR